MKNDQYKSILVIVTGFLVFFLLTKNVVFLYIALAVAVLTILFPIVGDYILKGWFAIGKALGFINSRILLTVIYYVFLVPLSFFSRLSKKDKLVLKKQSTESYFVTRNYTYTKSDLKNPW